MHAPNEAGKTTLQRFIYGMLYGFARFGYQRRYDTEDVARYRPWVGGPYGGTLVYRLENGRRFRIERDFETGAVRLYDEATGQDISRQFPTDRRRELLFADEQFGLSGPEFASTVFVHQLGAAQVDGLAGEAIARLANLRETGSEDVPAEQAVQRLREAADAVGSERAPTRPLGRALARVAELERACAAAEQAWEAAADARARAASCRADVAAAEERLADLQREQAAAEAAELAARLARVQAEQEKLSAAEAKLAELQQYAGFPRGEEAEARRFADQARQWQEQADKLADEIAAAEARLAEAEQMLAVFQPLQALGPGAAGGLDTAWEAYRLVHHGLTRRRQDLADRLAELKRHSGRLAELGLSPGDDVLAAVRAMELRLEQAEQARRQASATDVSGRIAQLEHELAGHRRQAASRRRIWLIAAGAALVVAVAAGLIVSPFAFAGAALAPLFWLLGEQAAKAELGAIAYKERDLAAERERQQQAHAAAAEAERQLTELLAAAGASDVPALRDKLAAARDAAIASARLGETVGELSQQVQEQEAELASRRAALSRFLQAAAATAERRQLHGEPPAALRQVAAAAATVSPADTAGQPCAAITEAAIEAARQQWHALDQAEQARREAAGALASLQARRDEALQRRDDAQRRLQDILQRAGQPDYDSYIEACQSRAAYDEWQRTAAEHRNVLATALDGRTAEQLAAARADAQAAAAGFSGEPRPLAVVQRLVAEAAAAVQYHRTELARAESEVETRLQAAPDLAQCEAELEEARAEAARLRGQRAALDLAQSLLEEVLQEQHRDFAPRLNALIGDLASRFTGGRYSQVRVSEDLGLTVEVPEDGSLRAVGALSAGTFDQFYFALRLAVADLIGRADEPLPLFLDDTFVQADASRLSACLSYVADLAAAGRQVWLFTCHDREASALRRLAAERSVPLTELTL